MTSTLLPSTPHQPRPLHPRPRPPHGAGPAVPPALTYAVRLADAADRMGDASDLAGLWPVITREALALIDADGVAVVEYRGRSSWCPLAIRLADDAETTRIPARIETAVRRGVLADPGERTDLDYPDGWASILVSAVDRRPSQVITRLVWFAGRPGAFAGLGDLADLLSRHAGIAARAVTARDTLGQAVAARQRVGQATGILMSRYGIMADQAMALLRHRSQHTNVKLRDVADEVILTGELPGD